MVLYAHEAATLDLVLGGCDSGGGLRWNTAPTCDWAHANKSSYILQLCSCMSCKTSTPGVPRKPKSLLAAEHGCASAYTHTATAVRSAVSQTCSATMSGVAHPIRCKCFTPFCKERTCWHTETASIKSDAPQIDLEPEDVPTPR